MLAEKSKKILMLRRSHISRNLSMFQPLTIFLHITFKKLISMVYTCELCDYHTTGSIDDLMAHIRGFHDIDIRPGKITTLIAMIVPSRTTMADD